MYLDKPEGIAKTSLKLLNPIPPGGLFSFQRYHVKKITTSSPLLISDNS